MFIVIENGEVHAPQPLGRTSLLTCNERIVRVGDVDLRQLDGLKVEYERIDAAGALVVPGLIDVHEHLLGGSGEGGWQTQTPEIGLREIVAGGITTVVGCLGTDTTTKTMEGLLARAKALRTEGLSAYLWSGGYDVPPRTLTGSVGRDILFIEEVIGAGELAIADRRSSAPRIDELARIVKSAYVAGTLSGKAGITHFHVGEEERRLADIRTLLNEYDVQPEWVYPTHVERSEALMDEAIDLSSKAVTVDLDTVEQDLPKWFRYYVEHGGDPKRITASSDAAISSPATLFAQIRSCIVDHGFDLGCVLPLVTTTPARALKLSGKGRIAPGADADLVVLRRGSLEIVDVVARGKRLLREGRVAVTPAFLEKSNRTVELYGKERSQTPRTDADRDRRA